jgi:SAM-dependent methyltransferase
MMIDTGREVRTESPRRRSSFLTPRALSNALRAGKELTDEDFDQFVPSQYQGACREATPLAVATRAIHLLTEGNAARVLDVGAGIGKFAIVGALRTSAVVTGVEHNLPLLRAARGVALRLGAKRVTMVHGSVSDMELCAFDAIYLFDPPLSPPGGIEEQPASRSSCTSLTWLKLRDASKGTRIVTYCGGGAPPGFRMALTEPAGDDTLTLFIKD